MRCSGKEKEKVGHHSSGRSRWRWLWPILAGVMVLLNGVLGMAADKDIGPALNMLLLSGSEQSSSTQPVNDTGITWSADYPSGNRGTCVEGAVVVQQDCRHGRDYLVNDDRDGVDGFSFTKLDATGADLPADATEFACVRDNVTGLVWETKTDDGGLRDKDWTYSWYNPDPATNGGQSGAENQGFCDNEDDCDTHNYIRRLNAEGLCGSSSWRMPWIGELRSIANYNYEGPGESGAVTAYFPNVALPAPYWSASPAADGGREAWAFNLENVYSFTAVHSGFGGGNLLHVLAVHGGPRIVSHGVEAVGSQFCNPNIPATTPRERFKDHGDGTVTDRRTGLMWSKCVFGQAKDDCSGGPVPAGATGNWQQAMAAIQQVNDTSGFASYHDWRLPNMKELASIIERSCLNPAINLHVFPNTPSELYWTSTPDDEDEEYTWAFRFNNGEDTQLPRTNSFYVRAVRGGQ